MGIYINGTTGTSVLPFRITGGTSITIASPATKISISLSTAIIGLLTTAQKVIINKIPII